ncbi:MMPL family transporter [Lactobacillus delbrueckii subsp. lactis]|uniref:MMPL family transporter n=7 Tax=Lactobacillus delbrueckii TaxID=1584 RepID=UPI0001EC323A|nr:MMPL family transporter [Lactobacillus delbrueckii]ADQ61760.1 RND superfamily resistance-nodulation-cell division:proton (H+) antiporter [Lactobacillus delbrueckii subsp. bulgaricus ND02]MBO3081718.1 MMPL family transporter [Lactobacillus delbrueckii subsp. bulgaricus]MCD5438117.1 MMPL family transporter [Lactobacillus delbrueckii subsp. lactis]MCD5468709.1 MMPL family transporter [Lactobacillus delbrueckii subsp. lactis]MDG5847800.1 MMPL family transporter [Lactobacillus delbrueckii]
MKKLLKNHLGALIAWVLILVISLVALPNVESLTRAHSEISLPSNVESEAAKLIKNEWGSKKKNTYEVAVVFNKKSGKLTETDQGNIEASIDRLTSNQKKYGIKDYLAPQDNIATKKLLKSKDGTTWVMQMNIAKSHGTISQVNDEINKAVKTSGVRTYVTGADVLNNDFTSSIREGIKKTELITVVFIFIVLIIVFQSPVVPLVSLLTVGVSFLVSFSIVTNLVNWVNFPFSNFTQVFMVIVLFGIGTDYNILLYNHFKEDLGNGLGVAEATKDSIKKAGRTILYSGSSILIGFSALGLANFSVYRSAAGVAVGVLVLLIVLLTLNPFFMATLGKKMFWPSKEFARENPSKMWHGISSATLKRPVVFLAAVAVVVTPFFVTYSNVLNYDDTAEISDSVPSKQGLNLVQKHFSKGMAMPSYLYIKSDHTLDNEKDLKLIDELTRKLRNSEGVDKVMSATEPYNEKIKLLYVKKQLKSVTDGTAKLEKGVGKLTKGSEQVTSGAKKLANGADQLDEGTGTLSDGAKDLYTGTVKLYNGSIALYDGAGTLFNGTKTLSVGADALYSGTRKLSSGANTLSAGTQKLKSGTSSLASGSQTLANGTGSLATGANSLYTGTQTLTNGAKDLTANMNTLVAGLDQLKSELSAESGSLDTSKLDQLSEGLTKLNTGLQQLNGVVSQINVPNIDTSKISSLVSGLQSLQGQVSNLKKGLTDTQSGLTTAGTGWGTASAAAGSLASSISKVSDPTLKAELQKELETLNSGLSSTKSGLDTVGSGLTTAGTAANNMKGAASDIRSAAGSLGSSTSAASTADLSTKVQQLQASVSQLASGSNILSTQAASGINRLKSGLSKIGQMQSAVDALAAGAHKLYTGSNSLYSGLSEGMAGALALSQGANQVNSGASAVASGASQVNSGAGQVNSGAGQLATGLASGVSGAAQLANGARRLTSGAGQLQSGASQLQNGLAQGVNGSSQLAEGADKLQSGTSQLSSGASKLAEKTPAITSGLTAVNNGLVSAGSYLNGLRKSEASDTFYVPSYVLKHNADLQKSLKVFLSPDKKSTMIIIILDSNPSSESAAKHSQALSAMARKSLKGTDLGKAEVEMGGQSSTIEDTKNTASGDFTRTMAIMLIGVGIALILITRSLLQPIYILGTLLLAYISSLSITRWVVSGVMGRSTLAWNVPFFTFIMLIALGVDYSIFVMMRYRDSDPHALPSARILKACTAIGTVVISAVVILGGTFAALIPSGVPTLIEVAIGVIIGLAILIFLMPINLSASTKLTYEGFPWPKWAGRKKGHSFGKKS